MYRSPRGTTDILPQQQKYRRYIESVFQRLALRYGYQRIDTPVFEDARLFVRSVGEETDIVQKETYTFEDRGHDLLTLRPEGTAPVCRAYLEHGMQQWPQPVRLYYYEPMFRYDRPQAGRYRQFHQFGVEAIGDADPAVDAEVVALAWRFVGGLGLKGMALLLNSIGDPQCRPSYIAALKAYYAPHRESLCADCRARFEHNPLRLLDCKVPHDRQVAQGAPRSTDYLCEPCRVHWETLQGYLKALRVPYTLDSRLVRGLDYYTRTVFEIVPREEGAQSTVCAGGRYDGLIQELGGPPTPGIGFASGIERLILNLQRQGVSVPEVYAAPVVVASVGTAANHEAMRLAETLRQRGVPAVLASPARSLRGQLRYATAMEAPLTVILGEDEVKAGTVSIKDMASGEQRPVPRVRAVAEVKEALKGRRAGAPLR